MGRPNPVRLIELGPGRGTLMSDALRAARIVPDFRAALDVTLVEISPTLASIQYEALLTCGAPIAWAREPRRSARRAGDHLRQRISRRAAGAPIRAHAAAAGASAWCASTKRASSPSASGERAGAQPQGRCGGRRGARDQRRRPPLHVRTRRAARQTGRRGAVHRLRPRGDQLRRDAAGGARPSLGRPADRSGRRRHHRACRFRRDGAQRARSGARSTARSIRATSCARSASTRARARSPNARPNARQEFEAARRRLVGKGEERDGRAVQGDGGRQPRGSASARLPARIRRSQP